VITSRITSKAQTTVPKEVRKALGAGPGDVLAYEIEGRRITVRKLQPIERAHLRALQETLSEWASPADAEAYDDL